MSMIRNRIEAILRFCKGQEADAVLLTQTHSLQYFTGFSGGEAVALLTPEKKILCTDSRYTTQAEKECPDYRILLIGGGVRASDLIAQEAESGKIGRILFEDQSMTCSDFSVYEKKMPQITFLPIGDAAVRLREVKTAQELEKLAVAEEIGSDAYRHILSILRPGITELFVAAELEGFMKKAGAENVSFDTIVASGVRSAMPHGAASTKVIEEGDYVTMDFGCICDGYCSDMTRTVVVGKASERQKEIYDVVLKAQNAGLSILKAGLKCSLADAAARKVITDAGFGEYFGHSLGHGVGLAIHELPCLAPRDDTLLVPGMVVTVEPGIYLPEFGGVRIEDMVAVTEEGIRNLTTAPKDFVEIL